MRWSLLIPLAVLSLSSCSDAPPQRFAVVKSREAVEPSCIVNALDAVPSVSNVSADPVDGTQQTLFMVTFDGYGRRHSAHLLKDQPREDRFWFGVLGTMEPRVCPTPGTLAAFDQASRDVMATVATVCFSGAPIERGGGC